MWLKKLIFAWVVYYGKKGEKPDSWAFIEASFTVFLIIVLNSMSIFSILSFYIEEMPQYMFEVTDDPAVNKLRAFPVALCVMLPFMPLFIMLCRSIRQNIDYFTSLSRSELRSYRIWYLAACGISFILAILTIVFFTDMD